MQNASENSPHVVFNLMASVVSAEFKCDQMPLCDEEC